MFNLSEYFSYICGVKHILISSADYFLRNLYKSTPEMWFYLSL